MDTHVQPSVFAIAMPPNEERLLLATGRYIGEGFDDARLDTLFLALPVSWKGTLVQYTGRLHRLHPGKRVGDGRDESKEAESVGVRARLAFVVEAIVDRDPSEASVRGDESEAGFALQGAGPGFGITPGTRDGWARIDRAADDRASGHWARECSARMYMGTISFPGKVAWGLRGDRPMNALRTPTGSSIRRAAASACAGTPAGSARSSEVHPRLADHA